MEQLGSNPALKALVRINGLKALQSLGLSKKISLALITKNKTVLNRLAKTPKIVSGYISIPSGYSAISKQNCMKKIQPSANSQAVGNKVA